MTAEPHEPVFLGGHPALDFLNTTFTPQGAAIEMIGDGAAFVAWLVKAERMDATTAAKLKRRFEGEALDAVAREARKQRDWAASWIERWSAAPGGDYEVELRRLNGLLRQAHGYRQLVVGEVGWELQERDHLATAEELIAMVMAPLAELVAHGAPELVRRCAGVDCSLWFLDRTKAHRRAFCSATACGNRAKVAAFRRRQQRG